MASEAEERSRLLLRERLRPLAVQDRRTKVLAAAAGRAARLALMCHWHTAGQDRLECRWTIESIAGTRALRAVGDNDQTTALKSGSAAMAASSISRRSTIGRSRTSFTGGFGGRMRWSSQSGCCSWLWRPQRPTSTGTSKGLSWRLTILSSRRGNFPSSPGPSRSPRDTSRRAITIHQVRRQARRSGCVPSGAKPHSQHRTRRSC
jgi:hypothetical protein